MVRVRRWHIGCQVKNDEAQYLNENDWMIESYVDFTIFEQHPEQRKDTHKFQWNAW